MVSVMKTGYKQTEIGVIPEDWEVKTIKEISNPVRGGSPRPAGSPKYFNGDYIPWLTVAALTNIPESQIFVSETEGCLTKEGSLHSRTLEKETLIIANSGATLGVAKLLAIKCCANDGIAALFYVDKNAEKLFVVYYINSLTKKLRTVIATGNGQPNLNTDLIGNIAIPYPSLAEQTTIAAALSDVDALMGELDKLIAKKRDIKQATMQQLLTGKKRLAGFSGEWEVKRLGDLIFSFQNGYGFSASGYVREGVPIVTMAQVGLDGCFQFDENKVNYWDSSTCSSLKSFHLNNGDVIIAMTDVTPEKNLIGRMTIVNSNKTLLLNQRVGHLRVDRIKVNPIFLISLSNMKKWRNYSIASASLGVQANIGTKDILNGVITLPTIEEQTAIATILSDMDAEISQLEARRTKTAQLKQGMMQELLTGRIRLC